MVRVEPSGPTIDPFAVTALTRFPVAPDAAIHLVRHGENTTYRVDEGNRRSYALRVHRPAYHSVDEIKAELAWVEALRAAGITTPEAICGLDGQPVQVIEQSGDMRAATMFRWVEGVPLSDRRESDAWSELGSVIARVHNHGRSWPRPPGFVRPAWDSDALVGEKPRWGDPDPHLLLLPDDRLLLFRCRDEVRRRLAAIGTDADRFGLIHGDLGFENVLITLDAEAVLIDFDDCGDGWFVYDLAVALYPHEEHPDFQKRRAALLTGYRRATTLPSGLEAELPTFLMARRLATLGWVFSRPETQHARRQSPSRLRTTPSAARRFLAWADNHPVGDTEQTTGV